MEGKRPEIRFKGYDDEWVSKQFGDAFDFISNNTLSRDNLNNESGAALNVHYGDVLIKFGEYLDVQKEQLPFISDEALVSKFQASLLRDGDVIIADTAEDTTVGKCTEIVCVDGKKIISGLHTMACRPKEKYTLRFLGYCLNSPKYHKNLLPLMQGVKVLSISKSGISDTNIVISENRDEQGKIANFLAALDREIKAELLMCEKLAILKKAMLKKMFPAAERKVPEIRFDGYTDDWEQRKFRDTFDIMQNNALSRADLSSAGGDVMNVHYGDVLVKYGEVLDVKKDEMTYLLDASLVNKHLASLLQNGDIIIADAAEDETVGKCSEIAGLTDEKVLSGLHTIPCRPRGNFAEGYLGYYMNSGSYHDQLLPLIQGTKVSSISKSAIQDTDIMYPKSETEQRQIGDYFRNLDHLITLHQCKLERLKNIKSACIKKMFV